MITLTDTDIAKRMQTRATATPSEAKPSETKPSEADSIMLPRRARLTELAEIFRLLADPSRLSLLLACLDRAWPASNLAEHCSLSPQAASHHLRLLKAARLVKAERHGKQVLYQADDDHVRHMLADLIAHLDEPHHPHSHQETAL